MAKIKRGILGIVQGTLSGLEFRYHRNKNIVVSKLKKRMSSRSDNQLNNQKTFLSAVTFALEFYHIFLKKSIRSNNIYLSSWNLFLKLNTYLFSQSGIFPSVELILSIGDRAPVLISALYYSQSLQRVTIVYTTPITSKEQSNSDILQFAFYNITRNTFVYPYQSGYRVNGSLTFDYSEYFNSNDEVVFFLWVIGIDSFATPSNSFAIESIIP